MSEYHNNSIFWVEVEKIQPNPFQPRREFEPGALEDLADSIRQYGVLQPLVVTRQETLRPDGNGMDVHYELIAGERRLRASKIAGLHQVPVIIRKETDQKVKLEIAIIENLQREDLNPIDRALAFEQLHKEFGLTHVEIGKRMGKSRVYVSNSIRLLALPQEMKQELMAGRITEGHTRPLLMLSDRPDEQITLFKEILIKKMSVRDAEKVARKIAQDRVRKKEFLFDPKLRKYENLLSENLGTRVQIEPKEHGGQITIDYFTYKDLEKILSSLQKTPEKQGFDNTYQSTLDTQISAQEKELSQTTGVHFPKEANLHSETPSSHREEQIQELVIPEPSLTEPPRPEPTPHIDNQQVTIPQHHAPSPQTPPSSYHGGERLLNTVVEPTQFSSEYDVPVNRYSPPTPQQGSPSYSKEHFGTPHQDPHAHQRGYQQYPPKKKGFFKKFFG